MSSFKDVRMRGFQDRAEVADVVALIDSRVQPLPPEDVDLHAAAGQIRDETGADVLAIPADVNSEDGIRRVKEGLAKQEVDALIAIGGEDTLGVAARLSGDYGIACVGVPKTIDNDLSATELTFGFHPAVQICVVPQPSRK